MTELKFFNGISDVIEKLKLTQHNTGKCVHLPHWCLSNLLVLSIQNCSRVFSSSFAFDWFFVHPKNYSFSTWILTDVLLRSRATVGFFKTFGFKKIIESDFMSLGTGLFWFLLSDTSVYLYYLFTSMNNLDRNNKIQNDSWVCICLNMYIHFDRNKTGN